MATRGLVNVGFRAPEVRRALDGILATNAHGPPPIVDLLRAAIAALT